MSLSRLVTSRQTSLQEMHPFPPANPWTFPSKVFRAFPRVCEGDFVEELYRAWGAGCKVNPSRLQIAKCFQCISHSEEFSQ